jgi:hypothetical protein
MGLRTPLAGSLRDVQLFSWNLWTMIWQLLAFFRETRKEKKKKNSVHTKGMGVGVSLHKGRKEDTRVQNWNGNIQWIEELGPQTYFCTSYSCR